MKKDTYRYDGVDFTGFRHGRLVAISKVPGTRTQWNCKCDCGRTVSLHAYRLMEYKSCGCLEKENRARLAEITKKHGMTETRLYSVWCGMKDRCYNPNYRYYHRYGGRGISMCDEWKNSFEAFRDWAIESGYDFSLSGKTDQSIDRIDLDGNYEPSNCKWSNQKEQVRNRSNAVRMTYNGKEMNPYEFAKIVGISYEAFVYRWLKKGYTAEMIIEEWNSKPRKNRKKK